VRTALVWTTIVLVAPLAPGVTTAGVNAAVAPGGSPAAVSVTGRLKLPVIDVTLIW
jgi:hypothetical protein